MTDVKGVVELAKNLITENPGNLNNCDQCLTHLSDSYTIAGETVELALANYLSLKTLLKPEEVSLAAGLHDIGRLLRKNQLFHELRGVRYVEERGLEKGVADNLVDVFRIAQMFRSHYIVAEQWTDDETVDERGEFEPLDSGLLVPRTLNEQIVVYAELSNMDGREVSFRDRIEDIKQRYSDPKWAVSNPSLLRIMRRGLPRVIEICERIERLVKGELKTEGVARYGFI